jgi:Na+/H+ antiporter NhaD/arsenite permease-like protein
MSTLATIGPDPPRLLMLPFAVLLVAVALAPVILRHHWERHYYKICFALAAFVCGYYLFIRGDVHRVTHALFEYFGFMVVVGSFFTVAGGIHLRTRSHSRPLTSTLFLLIGALLASVIGTVGASMLLIRPWIEMNKARFAGFHLGFFIFIVSNVGGLLLPVGPPLFLGYQNGVPFFWPLVRLWPHWLFVSALLLLIFYLIDLSNFRKLTDSAVATFSTAHFERWRLFGKRNFVFMSILLVALITLPSPARELVMIVAAIVSYVFSPRHVHEANAFTFLPLQEVAALFLGIFGTMIPVLDYVKLHASDLGVKTDAQFFWATGMLSALLDNAPTYLTFFAAALGLHGLDMSNTKDVAGFIALHDHSLVAISLGATLFGALTYIGNGPNLLVKAIAQNVNVPTPSFFAFVFKYAAPVLLPLFAVLSIVFFSK